jgi:hypothetical protein
MEKNPVFTVLWYFFFFKYKTVVKFQKASNPEYQGTQDDVDINTCITLSRISSVVIASRYELDGPGIETR